MDAVAERILTEGEVVDDEGRRHRLHSHTDLAQCERIQETIHALSPAVTLETGMAFGISTLFICEALREVGGRRHIVMDPFQNAEWHGVGLKNVRDAGYEDLVDFLPEPSQQVLPRLLDEHTKLGFAYLDAGKVFDHVLTNAYYVLRLLEVGGIMVLDDCNRPGLRKVCRYLARLPFLDVAWTHRRQQYHPRRQALSRIARHVPLAGQLFAQELLVTDRDLGVDASCVAFQKTGEDQRHWTWHAAF